MTTYKISRRAQAQLEDIYAYSNSSWGTGQADRYLDGIFASFERIANKTLTWRPIPTEFEVDGYYTRYKRHFIYWREFASGGIGIVTILHDAMLQSDRLRAAFSEVFEA